jgi:hypothetical protein
MPTSGCSCRYRSSLRTCSGGPGGTSCTGQYCYPARGQRNGFPKSPATRHRRRGHERLPPSRTCRRAGQTPAPPSHPEPLPAAPPSRDCWLPTNVVRLFRAQMRRGPPSCRIAGVGHSDTYLACRIPIHGSFHIVVTPCRT